jgi:hypothetical protein
MFTCITALDDSAFWMNYNPCTIYFTFCQSAHVVQVYVFGCDGSNLFVNWYGESSVCSLATFCCTPIFCELDEEERCEDTELERLDGNRNL